jgi:hypothetical protein
VDGKACHMLWAVWKQWWWRHRHNAPDYFMLEDRLNLSIHKKMGEEICPQDLVLVVMSALHQINLF